MQASNQPARIQIPFANSGVNRNVIPVASQIGITPGAASFTDGFPPLTFTAPNAGGIPPFGADFNGIIYDVTALGQWQSAGGLFLYDATWSTANNGYPKGCMLVSSSNNGYWINNVDNNTTDPDGGSSANWIPFGFTSLTAIAGLTNANVTLTAAQYRGLVVTLAGTLTGNIQIIMPTWRKEWTFYNNTTGNFTVTVKTASGTGVVIPQGAGSLYFTVWGDGTNIVMKDAYGITPAQFDISNLQATTAFLRTMGFVFSNVAILTGNTTLTAANAGGAVLGNSVSGWTATLPGANVSTNAGQVAIYFKNCNTGTMTINRVGSDVIQINDGTVTSLTLLDGDSALLINSGGGTWWLIDGSVLSQYVNTGAFGQNQTMQNVTASRALSTTYTNSTGRPIWVSVMTTNTVTSSTHQANITSGGQTMASVSHIASTSGTDEIWIGAPVLPGTSYSVTTTQGVLTLWKEMRL